MNENKVCITEENFTNALTAINREIRTVKAEEMQKIDFVETADKKSALKYFSELPKTKQDKIFNAWYERRYERFEKAGKLEELNSKEDYRKLFESSKTFKYDINLKAHRVSKTIEKRGTVDYAEIKKNQPIYFTYEGINQEKLFKALEKNEVAFSARIIGDNVKLTVPLMQVEQYREIANKLNLSMGKGTGVTL